jgi:flavin-dependent thymidylate synthase
MNNTVELIGYYGNDLTHSLSAWTSTIRDLGEDKLNRVDKLLASLAKDGHHTPFEKSSLHFLVNTDIATHIHLLKHRIGVSINAESARYKELKEDKMYIPEDWAGTKSTMLHHQGKDWGKVLEEYTSYGNRLYHMAVEDLTPVLGRKRAKESARFFKTYNSQISADISFNWRSFYHFLKLRYDEHAQLEVRELAGEMLRLVKSIEGNPFQHTLNAFGYGE